MPVLDFGGVLFRTLFETHDLTEATLGLPQGTLTRSRLFAPETDPPWVSLRRGAISEKGLLVYALRFQTELVAATPP